MRDLYNEFQVTKMYKKEEYSHELNTVYITGLYLEGASWNTETNQIVEAPDRQRFVQFPVIRVKTKRRGEDEELKRQEEELKQK
jgi:hypothetical protein